MEVKASNEKGRRGFLAMIWESMTKTGGCCGSGGNCCGSADPTDGDERAKDEMADGSAGGRHA